MITAQAPTPRSSQPVMPFPRRLVDDVLDRMTDDVWAIDRDWRFTYVDARAARRFDRPSPDGITVFFEDITAERQAVAETRRLHEVLDATQDLVLLSDTAGLIIHLNPAARSRSPRRSTSSTHDPVLLSVAGARLSGRLLSADRTPDPPPAIRSA